MATRPTEQTRVLFASAPHGGMFEAMVPLVAELAGRGRQVWFGSTEDKRAAAEKISDRVRFVPLGQPSPEWQPANWSPGMLRRLNSRSRLRGFAAFMDQGPPPAEGLVNYENTLRAIDEVRPDLMVIDSATTWAIDAAVRREVPYVLNSPMCVNYLYANRLSWRRHPWPYSALPPRLSARQRLANLGFLIGQIGTFMRPAFLRRNLPAVRERKRLDLWNPNALLWQYADRAEAVVGHSLFGIEHQLPDPPAHLRMVGPLVTDDDAAAHRDHGALFQWLGDGDPVIYIGLGTTSKPTAEQAGAIVEAVRAMAPRCRVLWSLRRDAMSALPDDLPPTLRVEEWVPQPSVLAHPNVRVFFSHGGNGGHHGLYHGKPLLCFPHTWELRDMSTRFAASGAALVVGRTWRPDPAEITRKLTALLEEPGYRARAEHWAGRFRQAGGVRAAVDLIVASA